MHVSDKPDVIAHLYDWCVLGLTVYQVLALYYFFIGLGIMCWKFLPQNFEQVVGDQVMILHPIPIIFHHSSLISQPRSDHFSNSNNSVII